MLSDALKVDYRDYLYHFLDFTGTRDLNVYDVDVQIYLDSYVAEGGGYVADLFKKYCENTQQSPEIVAASNFFRYTDFSEWFAILEGPASVDKVTARHKSAERLFGAGSTALGQLEFAKYWTLFQSALVKDDFADTWKEAAGKQYVELPEDLDGIANSVDGKSAFDPDVALAIEPLLAGLDVPLREAINNLYEQVLQPSSGLAGALRALRKDIIEYLAQGSTQKKEVQVQPVVASKSFTAGFLQYSNDQGLWVNRPAEVVPIANVDYIWDSAESPPRLVSDEDLATLNSSASPAPANVDAIPADKAAQEAAVQGVLDAYLEEALKEASSNPSAKNDPQEREWARIALEEVLRS